MSVSFANNVHDRPCFYTGDAFRLSPLHYPSYPSSKSSMFNNLKNKLHRKSSNPLTDQSSSRANTSSKPAGLRTGNSNPFTSTSPATRRPNNSSMDTSATNTPPPAYTSLGAQSSYVSASIPGIASSDSDPYAFLKSFDTVFLIDDSGSMAGRSWKETAKALETITPICTDHDADGIDVYFLNHPDSSLYKNITAAGTVVEIFQTVRPGGATPTGQRLNKILKPYLQRYQASPETTKPINIIVITDGEPSDDVESPIIQAAKKLDKLDAPAWQVGIQFFQVGKEPGAREHLKQLDDGLRELADDEELRDIVDTVPFSGDDNAQLTAAGILKCVLGAVNRRLDRTSKELHRKA
ncbi:hypothetical protein IQ06DRAFT_290943 [Phaeosphaeriaceae sp. SRC1lsM3a]|nr:hypothetical protein IQ06DRAFT_290943 [Stagonospora sp. SRC1lsM3a]